LSDFLDNQSILSLNRSIMRKNRQFLSVFASIFYIIASAPRLTYPENVRFAEEEDHGGVKEDFAVGNGREELERLPHVVRLDVGRRSRVRVRRSGLARRHRRRRPAADDGGSRHHVVRRQGHAERDGVHAVEQVQPLTAIWVQCYDFYQKNFGIFTLKQLFIF
jgi:hypothetical protein